MTATRHYGQLAVIVHADVVASTALVQRDERLAHERVQDAFRRFGEVIRRYGGRVHELRGDALLAEFERASDAVCAALSFQGDHVRYLERYDDEVLPRIRVGISIGEIVIADGTLTGAGVVLAQRIEQLAAPGGVCISAALREALPRRMPFKLTSLGEVSLKGFDDEARVHTVELAAGATVPPPQVPGRRKSAIRPAMLLPSLAALVLFALTAAWYLLRGADPVAIAPPDHAVVDRPSIAVMAFANLSGDPEQEYFSDGISEDLITGLSRLSNLAVIARNSSFTYKGTSAKAQDIGRDLGAKYLLEGSVRRAGDRLRISAQLVDASNGFHLWAERYDRRQNDIFDLQDEITGRIISALSVRLTGDESSRLPSRPTDSFEAYDLFLKAQGYYQQQTPQGLSQAATLYERVIGLDPDFARAYGALGVTLGRLYQVNFSDADDGARLDRARQLVDRAVTVDPDSPQAQWALGLVSLMRREFELAADAAHESVRLAPNYADGWLLLAAVHNNLGRGDQALRFIRKAHELNPLGGWNYSFNEGRAHYLLGDFDKAVEFLSDALVRNERALFPRVYLAASHARGGNLEEAEWQVSQLEVFNPGITLAAIAAQAPVSEGDHKQQLVNDLRRAGLAD